MQVAVARRTERPHWLNLRTVVGCVLLAIAAVSTWSVLGSAESGYWVWAARADLQEGDALGPADLQRVKVDLGPEQLALYLDASSSLSGARTLRALQAGELIPARWVTDQEMALDTSRAITIPVTPDHAVGGDVAPGDRVDVFATTSAGGRHPRTELLVADAEVIDQVDGGGLVLEEGSFVGLTVAVSPEDAARIAFAIRSAEVDVVRVDGLSSHSSSLSVSGSDL